MKDFDVIVIGSGIGGLVSAGMLSAGGLKTLLVEKERTPGGYLASFSRKGFSFDAAVDCISGVGPGGLISRVLDALDAGRYVDFVRLDPVRVSLFPGAKVIVPADMEAYAENLCRLFPKETHAVSELLREMRQVFDDAREAMDLAVTGGSGMDRISPLLLDYMCSDYAAIVGRWTGDRRLLSILSDRCTFLGLPPSQVSALSMTSLVMSYFVLGAYRPVGGFQALADALVKGVEGKGGRVVLGNGVRRIVVDADGTCSGIVCDNGDEYTARYIVSNADYHHTFATLIAGRFEKHAEEVKKAAGSSPSFFVVYAGVGGRAAEYSSIGYYHSYDMERIFSPGAAFREDTTLGLTLASVDDPSRAPRDCSTVVLHEIVASAGGPLDKKRCTELVLGKAEKVIPGLRERIVVLDSATPRTLERYTGNNDGAAFGWRQSPGFKRANRHGIPNLVIAGHWGTMGGGVIAAAYSGAAAAARVLAAEGVRGVI